MTNQVGKFIVIEGLDGSGKTTCIHSIREFLDQAKISHQLMREPGGTALGEKLRTLLLHDKDISLSNNKVELLLFYAARLESIQCIQRWLAQGIWVISDRFNDSSYAYQSYDGSVSEEDFAAIDRLCLGDFAPDLAILLDIDTESASKRLSQREGADSAYDRFQSRKHDYHHHLAERYLQRFKQKPDNHQIVDARQELATVCQKVLSLIQGLMP